MSMVKKAVCVFCPELPLLAVLLGAVWLARWVPL